MVGKAIRNLNLMSSIRVVSGGFRLFKTSKK